MPPLAVMVPQQSGGIRSASIATCVSETGAQPRIHLYYATRKRRMSESNARMRTPVQCEDRRCGQLIKVGVDPYTPRVRDLVVGREAFSKENVVVPVSAVSRDAEDDVDLPVGSEELDRLMESRDADYTEPKPGAA